MAISLFGPTSTTLGAAMGLDATELGLLVSVPSLTGSLLRIPFGAMVDTNGGRRGFLFLLAAAVLGLGALSILFTLYPVETPGSMTGLYPIVLLLGCLAGCGIATFSVGASQSNYWFAKSRQGYASGIYGGLGTTSAGILAFALPLLLHRFGFTAAYYILTGVMLLGLLLYIWLGANPPYFQFLKAGKSAEVARDNALACGQELFPKGNAATSLKISARIPQTWMLVLCYFTTFGGFMALTTVPHLLEERHGTGPDACWRSHGSILYPCCLATRARWQTIRPHRRRKGLHGRPCFIGSCRSADEYPNGMGGSLLRQPPHRCGIWLQQWRHDEARTRICQ